MKTKSIFLYALITVLTLTLGACASSDEDDVVVKDDFQDYGKAIKAQFSISIPMGAGQTTRMSSDVVQATANTDHSKFRGIDEIRLFPATVDASSFDASSSDLGSFIRLTQLLKPTGTVVNNSMPSGSSTLLSGSKSVLYGDVILTMGTKSFLFYGKAIDESTGGERVNGKLVTNVTEANIGKASEISFSPQPIFDGTGITIDDTSGTISETETGTNTSKRTALLNYLNAIADAKDASGTTWKPKANKDDTSDKGSTSNTLKVLYEEFIKMEAGSSKHIEALVEDLYQALAEDKFPSTWPDYSVAQAIRKVIENNTYVTVSTGKDENNNNVDIVTFKTSTDGTGLAGYPADINLLDGSAVIKWNSTSGKFEYNGGSSELNVGKITSYAYPANLYYWSKSDIKTSTTLQESNYTEDMTWDDNSSTGIFTKYTDGDVIKNDTRSVLLTNPVNYAVGRLDVVVTAASSGSSGNTLPDNGDAWKSKGVTTKNVKLSDIKLTGVIIGGQKAVDWKFNTSGSDEYAMYDDIVTSQGLSTKGLELGTSESATSAKNSTLVLETAGKQGTAEDKVTVVLEFVNEGPDFWGKDGIVPKGCKFYMVGELDASKYTTTQGYANTGGKVFKQDYVTTAKFTLNNLKQAVVTIPDLRNPAVELGLSVDLEWKTGISFSQTFE